MISSGINLVMTVIGFAVSTMFIVFVCTRLICARIQLSASRRSFPAASRSDLGMLERGLHGLEPPAIAKFPTRKFSDAYFSCSEDAQCTVCLADYHEEDTLRILSYCGHSFHSTCIDIWLQRHSTCPVCRISLRECPEKKASMQPMYSSAVRSRYDMECLDMDSYHCLLANHELPLRSGDNHSTNPTEENHFPSEIDGVEARGGNSILIEATHINKSSVNKPPVESPSNE